MQKFGRYEILEEIGRGGFGRVFRANDPLMKRQVAIKVMATTEDPELLARFRNEAASAGHLRHENIITIFDFGEEGGVPYIVMEYLQGMDLQQIQSRNVRQTLLEKVRILCQTACGLEAAHANGVIHRDVKPANIMILKDGSVKLMDFGIARLSQESGTRLTRTGMVVGTLQYLSPEQFEGQPVDALADLWGFGVIAFQLLSGRNPFDGADTANVVYRITAQQVPDIREISPAIPEDLAAVVTRLLRRERGARFQSFEDVRIELNPILERLEALEAGRLVDHAQTLTAQGELSGAHQLLRQVLDRHPSHTQARQLRDQIVAELRSNEVKHQVEEYLRKGDEELAQTHFAEAAYAYGQACRINPDNTTARLRLERANALAERARRTRAELQEARARLTAGAPKEAQNIVTVILAGDPENADAAALMGEIRAAIAKQNEAIRADAIARARRLASGEQYEPAIALLRNAIAQADHADLRKAEEEIRRTWAEKAEQRRIEEQLSKANEEIRQGRFTEALAILAPLQRQYPSHEGVRDTMGRATAEQARRAAREAVVEPPPPPPEPVLSPAKVIARALELSRECESRNDMDQAIHILDVALSRYPAGELLAERKRLTTPVMPKPQPAPPPVAPAVSASPRPIPAPIPPRSFKLYYALAGGALVCLAVVGLYVWQPQKPAVVPAAATELKPPQQVTLTSPKVETPVKENPPVVRKDEVKAPKEDPSLIAKKEAAPPKTVVEPVKTQSAPVETPKTAAAPPPTVAEAPPPKPSGPPPLANTPITPIPWNGSRRGSANWMGTLEPGGRLVLGSNGVQEGGGQLTVRGGFLPTVDMDVTELTPDLPHQVFPATRAQRVVITNNGSTPVNSLRFNWAVK